MKQKLFSQFFYLVILALLSVRAQGQVVRYKEASPDPRLWPTSHVDSAIQMMNERAKSVGLTFSKQIKNTIVRHDTIIYEYTLKGERTSDSRRENEQKQVTLIGKPLPAFMLSDLTGKQLYSKSLLGKPVVINMWFVNCPPCVAEMPILSRIRAEKAQKDVVFLAMTFESKERVQAFLQKHSFSFQHLIDAEKYCYQFTTIYPINIFVDRQGIIRNILPGIPIKYDEATGKIINADDQEFYAALKQIE